MQVANSLEHTLIVGASSPIAAAAIELFVLRGDKVSLIGRNPPSLNFLTDKQDVTFYSFDLEHLDGISTIYNEITINGDQPLTRICFFQRFRGNGDDWDGEINVSILATEKFIKEFSTRGSFVNMDRSIVIISSPADSGVVLEQPLSYHVGKAGISQMIKYLAGKLGNQGIRVNGIKPAMVFKERARDFYDNNQELVTLFNGVIPLGRMGLPLDIANATLFLNSDKSSYITGQIISVDGGLSVHENGSLSRMAASLFNEKLIDSRWKKS